MDVVWEMFRRCSAWSDPCEVSRYSPIWCGWLETKDSGVEAHAVLTAPQMQFHSGALAMFLVVQFCSRNTPKEIANLPIAVLPLRYVPVNASLY